MLNQVSKYALLVLVVVLLILLVSGNLLSSHPLVIIVQLLALGLAVWARRSFQAGQFSIGAEPTGGAMLASGPYQFIRHPMYAAALLLVWAGIFAHLSFLTVLAGLLLTVAIAARVMTEEQLLRARFPEYAAHAGKTKRLIPFII